MVGPGGGRRWWTGRRVRRRALSVLALSAAMVVVLLLVARWRIGSVAAGRVVSSVEAVPRRRVIAADVPPLDVTLDFAGFDTADSCERARRVVGVTDAVGFTPPVSPDATGGLGALAAREWLAGAKAMVEAEVLHTEPTFGGPFEGLSGSVVPANGP